MSIEEITEMAKAVGIVLPLIVAVVGIWKTLSVIRVKIEAETRLKESSEIESQIKLLNMFSKLMDVAHARSDYHFSETIASHIVNRSENKKDYSEAVVSFPVGLASQDAAISAIAQLAIKHDILKEPALQGLKTLKSFKPELATSCIQRINNG